MPDVHAILGPSSAHRWMVCTPSARLESKIEDKASPYAEEGTLAHKLAEVNLRAKYEGKDTKAELRKIRKDPLFNKDMEAYVDDYLNFIEEKYNEAKARSNDAKIFFEQRVDVSRFIPNGFGTADCVIIADGLMDVIDLKYGAGVSVSAVNNPQMMIYALGCWEEFGWAYQIDAVCMTIFQPRIDNISSDTRRMYDLIQWGINELAPRARLAWEGKGDFNPTDEACRFCKLGATCKARAQKAQDVAKYDFADPAFMDETDIADVLNKIPGLMAWAKTVETYAQDQAINHGVQYPGWKVVSGRSVRRYKDQKAIVQLLKEAGYKTGDFYKHRELIGVTALERLMGKQRMQEIIGEYLEKPAGTPTLVPAADKRPELNSAARAAEDFKEDYIDE